MLNLGPFLQELRKEHGYTQQEVADFLKLSNKTISKWERSEGYPELESLMELAKLYHISVDEILNKGRMSESSVIPSKRKDQFAYYCLFICSLLLFYLVYFTSHTFMIAFLTMMIADMLFFFILYYGIIPHNSLLDKITPLQMKDYLNFYLCRFILIVPCYNFVVYVPELIGNFPIHLTFPQYLNPWLILLLSVAMIVYYLARALYTKALKKLILPLSMLLLWGIVIFVTFFPIFQTTSKTMDVNQYETFKNKYIYTYQSFYEKYPETVKKIPSNLLRFNSFGFNQQIKDQTRYLKYRYVIGFDDAHSTVIYRPSDEIFMDTFKQGIKNTYQVAWIQIGIMVILQGVKLKLKQLRTYF